MEASVPPGSTLELVVPEFLQAMAAAGNPGLETVRMRGEDGGRQAVWRFSVRVWGEYALEPGGQWWAGAAVPGHYRLRWRRATNDEVAGAVSVDALRACASDNGVSIRRRAAGRDG